MKYKLGDVSELQQNRCNTFVINGKSIAVFSSGSTFVALSNICPHKGALMCDGDIRGTMVPSDPSDLSYEMEGQVLVCPWHGYEFDIRDGKPLFGITKAKLKTYQVVEEEGVLFIQL